MRLLFLRIVSSWFWPPSDANIKAYTGRADVIQKGTISVQDAERLLSTFKTDYGSFPFVSLPNIPMDSFRRERPLLLLAALTTASRKRFRLQESLEREFRKVLRYVNLVLVDLGHTPHFGSRNFLPFTGTVLSLR